MGSLFVYFSYGAVLTSNRRYIFLRPQYWKYVKEGLNLVSLAAVIRVVTQRPSPLVGGERCVTTLITAAKETRLNLAEVQSLNRYF